MPWAVEKIKKMGSFMLAHTTDGMTTGRWVGREISWECSKSARVTIIMCWPMGQDSTLGTGAGAAVN